MAATQPFRTALNGFNREDVVNYIEYLNNRHNVQMEQLHTQLQTAQEALAAAKETAKPAVDETLATQLEEANARIAALEAQLAERPVQASVPVESELEAYRRAERAERLAQERAAQIYAQANAVLADATVKAETASQQIAQLAEQANEQLIAYQAAVTNTQNLFQDVVASLAAIKPEEE